MSAKHVLFFIPRNVYDRMLSQRLLLNFCLITFFDHILLNQFLLKPILFILNFYQFQRAFSVRYHQHSRRPGLGKTRPKTKENVHVAWRRRLHRRSEKIARKTVRNAQLSTNSTDRRLHQN